MGDHIKLCTSTGDREVEAYVVGAWAAHQSLGLNYVWSVTHIASGRLVGDNFEESQAKAIAEALDRELGDPYPHPMPRDVHDIDLTPELRVSAERIKAIASILHVGPDNQRRGVRPARRSP